MTASAELIAKWEKLKQVGDLAALSKLTAITPQNVSRVRSGGNGTLKAIKTIAKFYDIREKEVLAFTSKSINQEQD